MVNDTPQPPYPLVRIAQEAGWVTGPVRMVLAVRPLPGFGSRTVQPAINTSRGGSSVKTRWILWSRLHPAQDCFVLMSRQTFVVSRCDVPSHHRMCADRPREEQLVLGAWFITRSPLSFVYICSFVEPESPEPEEAGVRVRSASCDVLCVVW